MCSTSVELVTLHVNHAAYTGSVTEGILQVFIHVFNMHRTSRLTLAILGFCLGSGVSGDMISPGYIPATPDSVVASGSLSNQPVNVMQTSQYAQLTVGFGRVVQTFHQKL